MPISLKAARIIAGYTQRTAIAELEKEGVKISKNTLSSYEKYSTQPDIKTAQTLAKIYGRTVDDIIFFVA